MSAVSATSKSSWCSWILSPPLTVWIALTSIKYAFPNSSTSTLGVRAWCKRASRTMRVPWNSYTMQTSLARWCCLFFTDLKMNDGPALGSNNAGNSHNPLAMIHANLSQLRVIINDESVFDSPLKFDWECSQNADGTYFYDYNKSRYLRGYNQVQDFFGKTYGTEIPITAADYCNHLFVVPLNLNLDRHVDNQKMRGNLSIDYQFTNVANSPVDLPSAASTSIKANLLCWDQYLYIMDKERGIKWDIV